MKSPLLSKFICCLELRTGGFVIGIIDCLLYGVLQAIFSLQMFFDIGFFDNERGVETFKRSLESWVTLSLLISVHRYFGVFPLIFLYVSFVISIVFLVGVKQVSSVHSAA